jgi:RimJ/RimL family protein N-acetyltransferase
MDSKIRTSRLLLRSWRPADAPALLTVLNDNTDHLAGWIPAAVSAPAPIAEISARLARYAADFDNDISWRFAIIRNTDGALLGEVSVFPRSISRRVALAAADRVEIGYWLGREVTGHGYVTEAVRALIRVAQGLPGIHCIEIRCDPANSASAAIPARLGFTLSNASDGHHIQGAPAAEPAVSVWVLPSITA